jgi:glycosyltransferase involved in cell wall biosynthesis
MKCNYKCSYCFVPEKEKQTEETIFDQYSPAEWIAAMKNYDQFDVEFYFWGGEPFILDGTYELVNGWTAYEHVTGGSRIDTNMAFANKIAEKCPTEKVALNCSWHTQYQSLDQLYQKVKQLHQHNMVGMVNFVASRYNLDILSRKYHSTIDHLVNMFDDIGVFVNIAADFAIVNGKDPSSYEDYKHMILKYLTPEDWAHLRCDKLPSICEANKHFFTIHQNGDITPCLSGNVCGNFFDGTLDFPEPAGCSKPCPSLVAYPFRRDNDFPFRKHLLEYVARNRAYRKSQQTLKTVGGFKENLVARQGPEKDDSSNHHVSDRPNATEQHNGTSSPRVSIVLPTYNHADLLPSAIESVLQQTFNDFEFIVVNDGSTDGTRSYLGGLHDPRIRVINQDNKGLPEALNAGFRAAQGELYTWVSSDNCCAPFFLEGLVSALDAFPDSDFAYSAFSWIDGHDHITGVHRDQDLRYPHLIAANPGIASFMYRRTCHGKVGFYNPDLEGAEDWDMWLRILQQSPPVYVPEILYYYRLHERSMTSQKQEQVFRASQKVIEAALARIGTPWDLKTLYPALSLCRNKINGALHAYFDFGTCLMQSPFAPLEAACEAFEAALAIAPDTPEVVANLLIAYGRLGRWDKTAGLLKSLEKNEHPLVRDMCSKLKEAQHKNDPASLAAAPIFIPDEASMELFQLQHRQRRVFSCTAPGPDGKARHGEAEHSMAASPLHSRDTQHDQDSEAKESPTVSVIVPTCNRPDFLVEAVKSILDQSYQDFEIIVVNDGEADVEHVLRPLNKKNNITCVNHPCNRGLSAARNTGVRLARGKYMAYLDDDDIFYPDHLETLVLSLEQSEFKVAYADAYRAHQVLKDGVYEVVQRDLVYSIDFSKELLLIQNISPVQCFLHEKVCLEQAGLFDETLTTHEDWDLWIRLSRIYDFRHIKKVTSEFRSREDGSSMTGSRLPDFLSTMNLIFEKYQDYTNHDPALLRRQQERLQVLKQQIQASKNGIECSIIIVAYNSAGEIEACIESIVQNTSLPHEMTMPLPTALKIISKPWTM